MSCFLCRSKRLADAPGIVNQPDMEAGQRPQSKPGLPNPVIRKQNSAFPRVVCGAVDRQENMEQDDELMEGLEGRT